ITFQLYNYWFGLADDCGIPSLTSLNPDDIAPYKNNMVLIDLRDTKDEPTLQVIGQLLSQDLDMDLSLKGISEIPRRTLLSRITDHYMEVLANKSPISFDAEFLNKEHKKIFYRGILLPFSDDGQSINFILGAIRWISEEEAKDKADRPTEDGIALPEVLPQDPPEEHSEESSKDLDKQLEKIPETEELEEVSENVTAAALQEPEEPQKIAESQELPKNQKPKEPAKREEIIENPENGSLILDHLARCRTLVQGQKPTDQRSRRSLYEALGAILDFHDFCLACPDSYRELLTTEGLKSQKRAPFTPTLKLCFGRDYDKTRLTEYAAALSFARKNNQNGKSLPDFLEDFPGGIKGCVREERESREKNSDAAPKATAIPQVKIKEMPCLASFDIPEDIKNDMEDDQDICLLLAQRNGTQINIIKIIKKDEKIIGTILKRMATDP
ncbi:MAG: hypothetical protein JKY45_03015, partial [Emcibacter sp.]|nr:hypothetical protein [Emcibacter sp.]